MVFGAMALGYSASHLTMDYSGRFTFHIFAPLYVFLVYVAAKLRGRLYLSISEDFSRRISVTLGVLVKFLALFLLIIFALLSDNLSLYTATYYPRAQTSHAELGRVISRIATKYGIRTFSFGDAGMAAYYSKTIALDNIGLASMAVARTGLDASLLDTYRPDLIAFHATPKGIRLEDYNQQSIHDWALSHDFRELCDIYWRPDYTIRLYARQPIVELTRLCAISKVRNNLSNLQMYQRALLLPPWKYWTDNGQSHE
jgi:hypothetical protein